MAPSLCNAFSREREREQHAMKDLSLRVERLKKQQSLGSIVVAVERGERMFGGSRKRGFLWLWLWIWPHHLSSAKQ